jgi:hypothetical protein
MRARKSANSNLPLLSRSTTLLHSASSASVGVWLRERTRRGSYYDEGGWYAEDDEVVVILVEELEGLFELCDLLLAQLVTLIHFIF